MKRIAAGPLAAERRQTSPAAYIAALTHGARSVLRGEVRSEKRCLPIPARSADSVELLVTTEPGSVLIASPRSFGLIPPLPGG
jgi:hypothetical protein